MITDENLIPVENRHPCYKRASQTAHVTQGLILEDIIGRDMPIEMVAKKYRISEDAVIKTIPLYYRKPAQTTTLLSIL